MVMNNLESYLPVDVVEPEDEEYVRCKTLIISVPLNRSNVIKLYSTAITWHRYIGFVDYMG